MSPPLPPRRPGSSPELQGIITPDQPERGAVRHHPGVDGAAQPAPRKSPTLTGMPAPPPLPGEIAPTLPAPNPLQRLTVRRPTPPSAVARARRTDPPPDPAPRSATPVSGQPATPLPPPSFHPAEAQAAAYKRRAEDAERRLARRDAEASRSSEAPASGDQVLSDEAIGKFVKEVTRVVLRKVGAPAALVAMLGGGAVAIKVANDRPAPPPLTKAEFDEALTHLRKDKGGLDDITRGQNDTIRLLKCVRRQQDRLGKATMPAPDHMGSTLKPQPWEDECGDNPKLLPEPD